MDRFIDSYEKFINMFNSGNVLISKKINVYDILDRDDLDEIILKFGEDLQKYKSSDFEPIFTLLKEDLELLKDIKILWKYIDNDPKLETFIESLKTDELKDKKIVLFTESKETGDYLFENLEQ